MVIKLHTLTPHESKMCPIYLRSKGHWALVIENGFRMITDSVIHLWSWNFIHMLPMSQGCTLLILRSRSCGIDDWKLFPEHNWLRNPPMIMKLHTPAPNALRMYLIRGPNVKIIWAWLIVNGSQTITDSVIHLWSWNFMKHTLAPHELSMYPIDIGVQRSRSLGIDVNGFWTITDSVIHLWPWNFIHSLPMS